MTEFDAESMAEHAVMLGLVSNEQAFQAKMDATDGSPEALLRTMLRKGMLTSWQIERLQKGDPSGFFYGGCKILFHLAEGTFARVYRGEKIQERQPVAVKVLRQRFVADSAAIERFNKEAEAGMKLTHENIVQIMDFGEQDKRYYMTMEYVEGTNLRDLLRIRTRIDGKSALPMMIGLARGLKYSHDCGVTHRDIKGTNILISNRGVAKLVDFGLATIEGEDKKSAALNQRTVDYSALERTCGSPKGDPRSDIFFLGCVFYQMLTGQLPMPEVEAKDPLAKMLKRSFGAIKPLGEQRHAPDERVTEVIEKMMKMDVKARYQAMEDVVRDLESYEAKLRAPVEEAPKSEEDIFERDEPVFEYRGGELQTVAVPETEAQLDDDEEDAAGEDSFEIEDADTKTQRPKKILCVEAQDDIQDAMRKSLSRMGYRVILVTDADLAGERFRESLPDVVIFDLDGLGHEGVDAFVDMHEKAQEDGQPLAALVLLGTKQHALREKLPAGDHFVVLGKPVKMKQVQDAVDKLMTLH